MKNRCRDCRIWFSSTTFHIPLLQTIEEYDIRAVLSSKEE